MFSLFRVCCSLALTFASVFAFAQAYPTKPIRLLVGFAPRGAADIFGRITAQGLGEAINEQVMADMRIGHG